MLFKNRRPLMGIVLIAAAMVPVAGVALRARAQAASTDEVLRLQKQFQDGCVAGDTKAVAALMTDEALFVHGNGAMQNKTEFLAAITNGQLALSAYDLKDPKVVLFDGGAIVTGLVDIAFKAPPGATAPARVLHMRGSSVWVHKSTGWLLVLDQDTTLAGPPPAPAAH
ncbi:MAG TPA: nuclear transport factor 2 family protein [Candidatus Acidoferrales bacterium]|nr:nuclear transport factor 2 family protein [Candidatus Acidoferrales bacterium]